MSDDPDVLPAWPLCPDCGRRRMTVCPFCQTAGQQFHLADPEYSVPAESPPDVSTAESRGPRCEGCGTDRGEGDDDNPPQWPDGATPGEPILMLTCPTCDEPFVPQFLRRCEWCGHWFPDGVENDVSPTQSGRPGEPSDPMTPQAVVTAAVLGVAAVALLIWLLWLM